MSARPPFQRILVPLDGSELATISVPHALALAAPETELVLCRIVPDPTPLTELAGTSAYPHDRITRSRLAEAEAYLDAVATALRDVPPRIRTVSMVGEPADALLELVEREAADLVVMASHGRGFLGRVVIGSVADRVSRAAPVPVMLIHPRRGDTATVRVGDHASLARIVVPLDGSARAREALPVATAMARQLEVPVHLVRAIPPRDGQPVHGHVPTEAEHEAFVSAARDALQHEAAHLAADGMRVTSDTAIGPAAAAILEGIGAGDVIVMTSHGRGGVRRWLLGSVAERLIHAGPAPVVLVPVAERAALASGLASVAGAS